MDDFLEVSWAWFAGWVALGRAQRALRGWKKIADSHVDSYFCFQMRFFAILNGFGRDLGTIFDDFSHFLLTSRFCENRCFS